MREIPYHKNTIYISHSISARKDADDAFRYIIHQLSNVYSKLADGHGYFKIMNGDHLEVGSIIECFEKAGNQSITHRYVVDEIIENERIQYASTPSHVKIELPWRTIETKSNTYVYYDVEADGENAVTIRLTIGIQFSNAFEKIFSSLTGGLSPWKKHCREEMEGLKKVLEDNS